jgi:hypothetical protein
VLAPIAWRSVDPANDNQLPLAARVQRVLFVVTAAASIGWLFWVGVLR